MKKCNNSSRYKQRLHQFLARVIFGVSIKQNGWIIDGGSNAGIMKALGNTREHLMYPSVPLIGIASQNLNLPKEALLDSTLEEMTPDGHTHQSTPLKPAHRQESDGGPHEYHTPTSVQYDKKLPDVDHNHSHLFFVGPKTPHSTATYGDENMFRRNFEVCNQCACVACACCLHGYAM